jgi:hypothetical protein
MPATRAALHYKIAYLFYMVAMCDLWALTLSSNGSRGGVARGLFEMVIR